ncbi:MAG TPA: ABC transporter permease, partial [Gemmatimonadaceae bacterium]|nr:ABC transporter permease [Gemmatimonadaceae bacterium]
MHRLVADLRFALRRARTRIGFTSIAVISLALGIGANTAVFSLVNAILLKRAPVPHRDQIAEIYEHQTNFAFAPFSYPDYAAFRNASGGVFSQISISAFTAAPRDFGDHVETLFGEMVNGDYFPLLGLTPQVGRMLGPEDDVAAGAHPVIVLSDEYWRRAFAADRNVVGREIRLGGRAYAIVGVAPRNYRGMMAGIVPAFFAPVKMINQLQPSSGDGLLDRDNHSLFLKVRLAPGASMTQAIARARSFTSDMAQQFPKSWPTST